MNIRCLASGSTGNAFIISDGETEILLDAGLQYDKLVEQSNYCLPENVLITHEHSDHSKAVDKLSAYGNRLYASQGTFEALGESNGQVVEALKPFKVGTFNIVPFELNHDAAEPLGFVCASTITGERVLYAPDTYWLHNRFAGITHYLVECNYDRETISEDVDDRHLRRAFDNHFSLQDLKIMLQSNDLSETEGIYLCHMSQNNLHWEKARKEVMELTGLPVLLCKPAGGFE